MFLTNPLPGTYVNFTVSLFKTPSFFSFSSAIVKALALFSNERKSQQRPDVKSAPIFNCNTHLPATRRQNITNMRYNSILNKYNYVHNGFT